MPGPLQCASYSSRRPRPGSIRAYSAAIKAELEKRLGFNLEPVRPYRFDGTGDRFGWTQTDDGFLHLCLYLRAGRVANTDERRLLDQLMDRLARGDDKVTSVGEYAAYVLYQKKGANIGFVAPPDGLPATPLVVGAVSKAPHSETAKLFVDWAMSLRGQKFYQDNLDLIYASVRDDAPPVVTGMRLKDFKLLAPDDLSDYLNSHDEFLREWGAMLGL